MKKLSVFLILSVLVSAGSRHLIAAPKKQDENPVANQPQQQPMSETVEGEVKEKLTIQKTPPKIDLDAADIVESGTPQTDSVLQQTKPIPSDFDFAMAVSTFNFTQIMDPTNPLIPEPPLVSFQTGLANAVAKKWEFRVSDDAGNVVKIMKGKGNPPRTIVWDGRGEKGSYITIGTLYSYQFITYDQFNNVSTYPGEPFTLDALMYKEKGKICVELANQKLYKEDGATISPAMKGLWNRAMDVIREHSNNPITVEIDVDKTKAASTELRRQAIVNAISVATNIPAAEIRHRIDKISDRGDVTRIILATR